ncbi:MAG: Crp/Fnr family transcriptional regulator [Bacteroidota bacterium]
MIDLQAIKAKYKITRKLDWEDVQILINAATQKTYQPGEYLISEGSLNRRIYFIAQGLVRSFAINSKGEEITTAVYWENMVAASPDVILFEQPCRFYYEAMEPTTVFSLDYDQVQQLLSKNVNLLESRKYILQMMLRMAFTRIESFVLNNPEERYVQFMEAYPDLHNRIQVKHIAHILGITPVSLSRIRKRLADKGE